MENNQRLSELSEAEFQKLVQRARSSPFSPFAAFCQQLKGYRLFYHGAFRDKWEIWFSGYKDAHDIISGNTPVKVINTVLWETN